MPTIATTRAPRRPPRPSTAVASWLVAITVALALGATAAPASAADPTARPVTPVATLGPRAAATPAPGVTQLGTSITFHGRGWGHGVGLSQYGAKGRAAAGFTATEILAHYYGGTTLGSLPLDTPIRVRIMAGFAASASTPLVLYGRGGPWTIDGVEGVFPKDAKASVVPTVAGGTTTWRVTVTSTAGTKLHEATTGSFRMRPDGASSLIQVWSNPSTYDTYRGVIRARLHTTDTKADVINELPLETYLRGVVPAEMPASWAAEALKAQTIAARSYAARRLRPGESYYDVNDDTSSQVYHGQEREHASTDAAILATAGAVLRSGSSIANTLFHSAGGGATEHNENVFVSATGAKVAGPVSYLRGVNDRAPDGTPYDEDSPYATWKTKTYTRSQLSSWFGKDARTNVGSLTALDLRDRGVSGRLIRVTLIGSLGSKTVSGDVFRAVFNANRPAGDPMMRSTLVDTRPVP